MVFSHGGIHNWLVLLRNYSIKYQYKYFLGGICKNIFYIVLHNPQCLSENYIYEYSINIFQMKAIRDQIVINSIANMEKYNKVYSGWKTTMQSTNSKRPLILKRCWRKRRKWKVVVRYLPVFSVSNSFWKTAKKPLMNEHVLWSIACKLKDQGIW